MITLRRHGAALMCGLATGAVLMGTVSAVPSEALPTSWSTALGAVAAAPWLPAAEAETAAPLPLPGAAASDVPLLPSQTAPPPDPTSEAPPPNSHTPAPVADPVPTPTRPPVVSLVLAPAGTSGVVALTNVARADAGCAPFRRDDRLDAAAQNHSVDMATTIYFSHDSRDGGTFADRIIAAGYPSPGGENIARGQKSATEVVQAWMNSPGHKRNILDCTFTTIGVGFDERGNYWTQDFGR